MSDNKRELLQLAAKAAKIELNNGKVPYVSSDGLAKGWKDWNPLTDDGDALRLAVKCGLLNLDDALFYYGGSIDFQHDPYAATRLAIVRNAAEIGRKMV